MRLLFLNHNYRYSGTYYRALPMAEHLAQRGHEVTLLVVSPRRPWRAVWGRERGVRVGEMPNWALGETAEGYGPLDNLWRIAHAAGHRYDIVHMFDHKPNATFAGQVARWRGATLIADWADWWGGAGGVNDVSGRRFPIVSRFEARWEERSKLWADGVVTISTVLRARALALGCPPARVLWLPSGAPTARIQPLPMRVARQKLGVPEERRIVGFIGMGQGDLEIVMRAQQQLSDLWLLVIGKMRPQTRQLAESLGVAERLWQTGFVPDEEVGTYLACADVMALPLADRAANRGRFPNKLLDYLAAGRPVVASPVGDVATIVQTHAVGYLAEAAAFAEALDSLLQDAELRAQLGGHARHVAETLFAWPHLISQLEAFYEGVQRG